MFAQRVAARQGTAAERVSLIGDDKAEPIARHAPARRGGLAAAVVARTGSGTRLAALGRRRNATLAPAANRTAAPAAPAAPVASSASGSGRSGKTARTAGAM